MKVQFMIEGPLMGYRQTTRRTMFHPKERARSKAYGEWKGKVLALAIAAGCPNMGTSSEDNAPRLSVHVFWKGPTRIDWKNIYGAIEDSLWYLPQGDRYVRPGKYSDISWGAPREEALVTVEWHGTICL